MIKVRAPKHKAVHLSSTAGVAVRLKADQERVLPNLFHAVAAKQGCFVAPVEDDAPSVTVTGDVERLERLEKAVRHVVSEGNPNHFTGQGKPRVAVVRELAQVEFTGDELNAAVEKVTDGDLAT